MYHGDIRALDDRRLWDRNRSKLQDGRGVDSRIMFLCVSKHKEHVTCFSPKHSPTAGVYVRISCACWIHPELAHDTFDVEIDCSDVEL